MTLLSVKLLKKDFRATCFLSALVDPIDWDTHACMFHSLYLPIYMWVHPYAHTTTCEHVHTRAYEQPIHAHATDIYLFACMDARVGPVHACQHLCVHVHLYIWVRPYTHATHTQAPLRMYESPSSPTAPTAPFGAQTVLRYARGFSLTCIGGADVCRTKAKQHH